jgi:hypothetical protein
MAKSKAEFRSALSTLTDLASGLPPEQRRQFLASVNAIDRFSGDLRRKLALLKKEVENRSNDVSAFKCANIKLTSDVAKLDAIRRESDRKLVEAQKGYERSLSEARRPGIVLPSAQHTDATFWVVKAKCLACSLHFLLATWEPDKHDRTTLYCPECGQHEGSYLVWKDSVHGYIFELIGGSSPLAM